MDHSSATYFALLADYYVGCLDKDARLEVEAHIVGCESCQELLRTMALLSGAAPDEVTLRAGDHPTLHELVRFYREPDVLSAGESKRIADHIAGCEDCAGELHFLGEVERELARSLSSGDE